MLVETSAIVAILLDEPEHDRFLAAINASPRPCTTVANAVEASLGVGKQIGDFARAGEIVKAFADETGVVIHDIPSELLQAVVDAYARYGKGTSHAARLNFGDCFSYAFAKAHGLPLLFKGDDFSKTDVQPAL